MPIGSGVAHTGDAESGAEEGSAHEATLLERRAKATERQRRSRSNRKMIASSLAAMAAAPPTMCVVGANDRLVDGDTKPSASVHTCGATVVRDIITKDHFKVSDFEKLAPKMEGLFGEGVFKDYAKSTERSNRYSMQLLPRVKGPTPEDAPWMQAMVERVRDVLGPDGLKILGPQHQFGAMTLLLSDGRGQGACQQDWHCDYDWKAKVFNKYGKKLKHGGSVPYPVSVLIACHEDGSSSASWVRHRVCPFSQWPRAQARTEEGSWIHPWRMCAELCAARSAGSRVLWRRAAQRLKRVMRSSAAGWSRP
jgi:hypothetical protein